MSKVKTHIILPHDLLEDIDKIVGNRKRSSFLTEAAREKLERVKLARALEEARGAWKDEDYKELYSIDDIREWVRDLRQENSKRLQKR